LLLFLSGKGPAMSLAILSNGALTYWCIRTRLVVLGPRITVLVSHCWHHLSTSLFECSQYYHRLTLPRVFLTPRCPPDGSPWSSVSTSLTLLRGRTVFAVFVLPSADSQWGFSTPPLPSRVFHRAQ
jgi:hypothetical protein